MVLSLEVFVQLSLLHRHPRVRLSPDLSRVHCSIRLMVLEFEASLMLHGSCAPCPGVRFHIQSFNAVWAVPLSFCLDRGIMK